MTEWIITIERREEGLPVLCMKQSIHDRDLTETELGEPIVKATAARMFRAIASYTKDPN